MLAKKRSGKILAWLAQNVNEAFPHHSFQKTRWKKQDSLSKISSSQLMLDSKEEFVESYESILLEIMKVAMMKKNQKRKRKRRRAGK